MRMETAPEYVYHGRSYVNKSNPTLILSFCTFLLSMLKVVIVKFNNSNFFCRRGFSFYHPGCQSKRFRWSSFSK